MASIPKIPEVSMTITGEMSMAGADLAAHIIAVGFAGLLFSLGMAAIIWAARRALKGKNKEPE